MLKIDFFFFLSCNLVRCYAPHLLHNMERFKSLIFRKRKHVSDRKLSLRISLCACQSIGLFPWSQLTYLPVKGSPRSWLFIILTQKKLLLMKTKRLLVFKDKIQRF